MAEVNLAAPADPATAPAPAVSAPAPTPAAATEPKTLLTAEPAKPVDAPADAKPAEPAKAAVPEKYDFKLPDGKTLDAAVSDAMTPAFKELGLSQEQVNKLVEPYNKAMLANEQKAEADFQAFMADSAKKNVDAIKKDWGHDFDSNLSIAQKGLARLFDGEGKKLLDETGLGNNPHFLKAFLAVGKMISEDKPPVAALSAGATRDPASVLYGSSKSN